MEKSINIKKWYSENFPEFLRSLNGDNSSLIKETRNKAYEKFTSLNTPTNKDEEWKYTNLAPLLKYNFKTAVELPQVTHEDIAPYLYNDMDCCLVVFVNGLYSEALSHVNQDLKVKTIASALKDEEPAVKEYFGKIAVIDGEIFTALNTAFMKDGVFIEIPDGRVIEKPVHLLFFSTEGKNRADGSGIEGSYKAGGTNSEEKANLQSGDSKPSSQPRNLIVAGKNSQAVIIEHYAGNDGDIYFTNSTTEIYLKENAVLDHVRIQEESRSAFHISRMEIEQDRSSTFTSNLFSTGAEIARNNFTIRFNGEGCEAVLDGLYMISGSQLFDAHTLIDHAKPYCNSHEHYKGILDEKSRGVFNGKVMVRKDAQKTNAFQENNNVILSNEALVNTKPQLEIFADDVKCSHGATIGQLDNDALFYLKTRGIGIDEAKLILLHAFASDVVRKIKVVQVKDQIEQILTEKFEK